MPASCCVPPRNGFTQRGATTNRKISLQFRATPLRTPQPGTHHRIGPNPDAYNARDAILSELRSATSLSPMSDLEPQTALQIERLRAGDHEALGAYFAQFREKLRKMVQFRMPQRLQTRLDADDVLQDAFLAATQRTAHCTAADETQVFVWLRLITLQTLTDLTRAQLASQKRNPNREQAHAPANADSTAASLIAQLEGAITSPSGQLRQSERTAQLASVLDQLPGADREMIALRHFEELSNSEAAATLDLAAGTASMRYVRALQRFRDALIAAKLDLTVLDAASEATQERPR